MIKLLLLFLYSCFLSSCSVTLFPELTEKTKVAVNFSSIREPINCNLDSESKKSIYLRRININPPYSNIRIFNCDDNNPSIISTNKNLEFAAPLDSMFQSEFDLFFRKNIVGLELLGLDSAARADSEIGLNIYRFCISETNKIKLEATVSIDPIFQSNVRNPKSNVISIDYKSNSTKSVEENISLAFLELSKQISSWILQTDLCLVNLSR